MRDPGTAALGTWSGGRFMRFGEAIDEDRLIDVIRPDEAIDTVITADTYGEGAADELLGRALEGIDRDRYSLVGAVGHDFYEGERAGPRGYPRFTDPSLRPPAEYDDYLRMAAERSLERLGVDSFDLLLLHNPDRIGYTDEMVWDGMAALKADGLAGAIGIAPGPANGFTLDLIDCFERFGSRIDWAMIILNPLEPWPGELVLDAAAEHGVKLITRVVDYGGLFWDDVLPGAEMEEHDHRRFRPDGWIERGRESLDALRPFADRAGLTPIQLACQWNLGHTAVRCCAPTLIQETGSGARSIEEKRAELAAIPEEQQLSAADIDEIREIGDNTGSMALKGGNPSHEGDPGPDRWPLDGGLAAVAEKWQIDPARDLAGPVTAA